MTIKELLDLLTDRAREYSETESKGSIIRNRHMNDLSKESAEALTPEQINAVLADYINFVAMKNGVDYGLYTEDI